MRCAARLCAEAFFILLVYSVYGVEEMFKFLFHYLHILLRAHPAVLCLPFVYHIIVIKLISRSLIQ